MKQKFWWLAFRNFWSLIERKKSVSIKLEFFHIFHNSVDIKILNSKFCGHEQSWIQIFHPLLRFWENRFLPCGCFIWKFKHSFIHLNRMQKNKIDHCSLALYFVSLDSSSMKTQIFLPLVCERLLCFLGTFPGLNQVVDLIIIFMSRQLILADLVSAHMMVHDVLY